MASRRRICAAWSTTPRSNWAPASRHRRRQRGGQSRPRRRRHRRSDRDATMPSSSARIGAEALGGKGGGGRPDLAQAGGADGAQSRPGARGDRGKDRGAGRARPMRAKRRSGKRLRHERRDRLAPLAAGGPRHSRSRRRRPSRRPHRQRLHRHSHRLERHRLRRRDGRRARRPLRRGVRDLQRLLGDRVQHRISAAAVERGRDPDAEPDAALAGAAPIRARGRSC